MTASAAVTVNAKDIPMNTLCRSLLATALALSLSGPVSAAAFVFHGQMEDGADLAEGRYALRLTLYADQGSVVPLAGPLELLDVPMRNGRFSAEVDFGELAGVDDAWLEVAARPLGDTGDYVAVDQRSPVKLGAGTTCPASWALDGNALTNPAVHFVGTLDEQPLVFRVNATEALRLRQDSASFDAGGGVIADLSGMTVIANGNLVADSAVGATLLGGGVVELDGVPLYEANRIVRTGPTPLTAAYVTIGGGIANQAEGFAATIGGGLENQLEGDQSVIGGGWNNSIAANRAVIGGGDENIVSGSAAVVGGGSMNTVAAPNSVVGGGSGNQVLSGSSVIAGGADNVVNSGTGSAFIGGGQYNVIDGTRGAVAGGFNNRAASEGAVAGGANNHAFGSRSAVPGGFVNCAGGLLSFAGGSRAKVRLPNSVPAPTEGACVGVPQSGSSGDMGTFLWADNSASVDFLSSGMNRFEVRATGGVRFVSAINGAGAATAGVSLASGSGSWASLSDRRAKSDIETVDPTDALARVLALPIYTWRYSAQAKGIRHMGPMAQDFHAAFGLNGDDDTTISTVDPDGVALAAIQGLNARLEAENAALRTQLDALIKRVEAIEQRRPSH